MLTEGPGDESLATLVGVVLKVAQMHGSSVSLSDLAQLLPVGTTSKDIADAVEILPAGPGTYALRDGLLVPKVGNQLPSIDFNQKLRHSITNVRVARWLSNALGRKEALTIAVSGSTSYKAASPRDDVDLFCVTRPETMWLFLAKALLLTRTSRVLRRSNVPICLSCVMDENYATSLFAKDGGALLARDALVAEVVLGNEQYATLLNYAPWMRRYFPKLYDSRSVTGATRKNAGSRRSAWARCVNLFLFTTVGSYIRAKAILHNHILAKQGKGLSTFRARAGPDHLIYESAKYNKLKEIYEDIRPISKESRNNSGSGGLTPLISVEREAQ